MGDKTNNPAEGCSCQVVSLVSVDERGQMVLPKDVRDRAAIKAGDKLALIAWEKCGSVCCLALIKADELAEVVKQKLGPVLADIMGK